MLTISCTRVLISSSLILPISTRLYGLISFLPPIRVIDRDYLYCKLDLRSISRVSTITKIPGSRKGTE